MVDKVTYSINDIAQKYVYVTIEYYYVLLCTQ